MEHMVSEGGIVVYNPTAGRGQAAKLREEAQIRLGDSFEWVSTLRAGHAVELAREAAKTHPVVVAFGGDGTVGDVMRGVLGTECTLGVLPAGTGNDLARNLRIPLDMKEAVSTVLGGHVRKIDIGTMNGTPFINNAGLGFDAQVMRTMNSSIRFKKGQTAFILATLKTLPKFKPFTVTMVVDDEETITEKAMLVSILNGPMYAGGMMAAPTADMDDGQLDVMLVRALPKPQLLALFPKVIAGKHVGNPAVRMLKVRKMTITCTPPQPLNIDGDVQLPAPVEIGVIPKALKVLVR